MDVNVAVPLLLALCAVSAGLVRQWWIVVLPLAAVPLFYAGLRNGWWGDGVGDGWQYAAVMMMVVGFVGSILGVALGRFLVRRERH